MAFRNQKHTQKKKKPIKLYVFITIACAASAVLISFFQYETPKSQDTDNLMRNAAEQFLGRKIDAETFEKLKKKYEAGELE